VDGADALSRPGDGVTETSSTSHNTTSATQTTSANGGVLLACAGLNGSDVTLSPEAGFSSLGNANTNVVMLERITTGSYSGRATFSTTSARTSNACFLSLKAPAAAAGKVPWHLLLNPISQAL